MSVTAPPRPPAPRGPHGGQPGRSSAPAGIIVGEQPLRRPDTRSPQLMTRRAWWLVALNFLMPGAAQSLAGSRRLGRVGLTATLIMWTLVVLAVAAALVWPGLLPVLATNVAFLLGAQLLLLAYAI
ncbi:MAG TPA: transcriptional regulator, partial [Microbacterium sp.]|nr:transcriptional regulator [Microbacterium sp.]